jgi:hypothetical protein
MLRKLIQAGAVLALLTGPASAQSMNMTPDFSTHKTQGEQQRDREIELKYHETVDSLPDRKASNDPWGNVRAAPAAKQPATAAKKPQQAN